MVFPIIEDMCYDTLYNMNAKTIFTASEIAQVSLDTELKKNTKKCKRAGCNADAWVLYDNIDLTIKKVTRDYCKKCYNMLSKRLPPKRVSTKSNKNKINSMLSIVSTIRAESKIERPKTPEKKVVVEKPVIIQKKHHVTLADIMNSIREPTVPL